MFEMLRYVSSSVSPLIYTNSVSRFLPYVRFSDLLIFASSRAGVLPLDAVQFGKMRPPSVRSVAVATLSCTSYRPLHKQSLFCFVSVLLLLY
jgi:hypothetical protein